MGEALTSATIWLAMLAWGGGIMGAGRWRKIERWCWTVALFFYGAHILVAYHSYYAWSHSVAWNETAQETAEVTGALTGVGLAVNYMFGVLLLYDVVSQWKNGNRKFPVWIDGVVFFMLVNGAIVFGDGAVRWFGCVLAITIMCRWIYITLEGRVKF